MQSSVSAFSLTYHAEDCSVEQNRELGPPTDKMARWICAISWMFAAVKQSSTELVSVVEASQLYGGMVRKKYIFAKLSPTASSCVSSNSQKVAVVRLQTPLTSRRAIPIVSFCSAGEKAPQSARHLPKCPCFQNTADEWDDALPSPNSGSVQMWESTLDVSSCAEIWLQNPWCPG